MKSVLKVFLMSITSFFITGCSIVNVGFDQSRTTYFNQYKTFAWYAINPTKPTNGEYDNQIVESNIKNLVSGQLKIRGLTVELDTPDVLFYYDFKIEQQFNQQQVPVFSHPYNYNNGFNNNNRFNNNRYDNNFNNNGFNQMPLNPNNNYQQVISGYQTQNIPYKDGTLTISMVDKKTNMLIWRGWGEGALTDVQTYEAQLPEVIKEIFKNFPVRIRSNYYH